MEQPAVKFKRVGTKCDAFLVVVYKVFIFITVLIPSIGFFILSIIPFDSKCKTYFILVFVLQGLYLVFFILMGVTAAAANDEDENGGDCFVCVLILGICAFLGMEITCLVFFIRAFSKLKLLAKIGYFVHWSYIPLAIIIELLGKTVDRKEGFVILNKALNDLTKEAQNEQSI